MKLNHKTLDNNQFLCVDTPFMDKNWVSILNYFSRLSLKDEELINTDLQHPQFVRKVKIGSCTVKMKRDRNKTMIPLNVSFK